MSNAAIEVKRLTRYFSDRPVVRDLDFSVPKGKVTALLGLNGAGKTTTIRIMMGLLTPTRGQAITLGEDATQMSVKTRSRIGYLVEGHFLYPSMRVTDCEAYQRVGYQTWDDSMFKEIVHHFGIDPRDRISTLSRGQRAGVSLGLVLAPNPELLVLDDPALGLDPVSRRALNETLIEFAGGGKRTVLLSTHLLDDVERIADRVAVMVGGRLKVDATLEAFRDRVTMYTVAAEKVVDVSGNPFATLPGLIEARRLGSSWQLAVADADQETDAALDRIATGEHPPTDTTFSAAVLAYLTRDRGESSFLSPDRAGSAPAAESAYPVSDDNV